MKPSQAPTLHRREISAPSDSRMPTLSSRGVLVGASRSRVPAGAEERFSLDLLDLDADEGALIRIPLPFPAHGLAIHPVNRREAVLVEKRGRGGCVADLTGHQVLLSFEPTANRVFYGHCAYSQAGDVVFVVETHVNSREGAVSVRDSSTFAVLGTLPTYGIAPHDCHLIEDGRTLAITNGGGAADSPDLPSVTFVAVTSGMLLEKHDMPLQHLNMGHIAVADNRAFVAVSAPRDGLPAKNSLGGVTLRRRGDRCAQMAAPQAVASRLVGESLSVAVHPALRMAVATHPEADLVTFWSLDSGKLVATMELPQPRGVTLTLDQQSFAFCYGSEARLLIVEARALRALSCSKFGAGLMGGAHLYTWARCTPHDA